MEELPVQLQGGYTYDRHQVEGIWWALEKERPDCNMSIEEAEEWTESGGVGQGGFIFDDMGLGKTITMIGIMLNNPMKTLIVVPHILLDQWISEITLTAP